MYVCLKMHRKDYNFSKKLLNELLTLPNHRYVLVILIINVNSPFLFKLKSLWSTNKVKSSKQDFLLQIKWFLVLMEMYDCYNRLQIYGCRQKQNYNEYLMICGNWRRSENSPIKRMKYKYNHARLKQSKGCMTDLVQYFQWNFITFIYTQKIFQKGL